MEKSPASAKVRISAAAVAAVAAPAAGRKRQRAHRTHERTLGPDSAAAVHVAGLLQRLPIGLADTQTHKHAHTQTHIHKPTVCTVLIYAFTVDCKQRLG